MVIGNHLEKPWLTLVEPSVVLGLDEQIIRDIDQDAMKADFFNTLNGKPTALPPMQQK
jgi:hypothetical protein